MQRAEAPVPSALARIICCRLREAAAGQRRAHLGSAQRKHSVRRAKLLAPHEGQGQSPAATLSQSGPCKLVLLLSSCANSSEGMRRPRFREVMRHLEQICAKKPGTNCSVWPAVCQC